MNSTDQETDEEQTVFVIIGRVFGKRRAVTLVDG